MTDKQLRDIEYSLHMAQMWIISLKHADAVYRDDLVKWKRAKKWAEKERAKLLKK